MRWKTRGDRPAIREKKFGIWQPTSWREWLQISKDIAYALHAIGFAAGDVASIIANAVPEWVFADMGILCAGGVSSGIYPTDSVEPGRISRQRLPAPRDLRRGRRAARQDPVVPGALSDPATDRGVRHGRPQRLLRSDGDVACRIHRARAATISQAMRRSGTRWSRAAASDDLAILVYTSGTTGPPKGAMHSNRGVTHQMRHATDLFPSDRREERLVFLPLCHVAERVGGYYISLAVGSVMNFAESPETVPDNLARSAADRIPGGAADLGEVLFGRHHRAEGCNRRSRTGCTGARSRSVIA